MNIIKEIETQYFEIEHEYASKEFSARAKGHYKKEAFWQKKRELNTHAYFLFLFTRLEDHIRTQSNKLINNKKESIEHWKTRAVWDITNTDSLHFKKRLGLLTEKGQNDYNTIVNYYNERNIIGHGGTIQGISSAINMLDVFDNMKRFFKELKR